MNEAQNDHDDAGASPPEKSVKSQSRRTEMSLDKATGRYCAKLGRKKTKSGKTDGHKFRFTTAPKESERRKIRIQGMWDRLVQLHEGDYYWDNESLGVAQALAEGRSEMQFTVEQLAPPGKVQEQSPSYDHPSSSMPRSLCGFKTPLLIFLSFLLLKMLNLRQ